MTIEIPYTDKPEDITRLLELIPAVQVPAGKIDEGYLASLGFSAGSAAYLLNILKMLGFIDEQERPSPTWSAYAKNEDRGKVLAVAVKKAYEDLFVESLCPYLEEDEGLVNYLKRIRESTNEELDNMIYTFRSLCEKADFQDLLLLDEAEAPPAPAESQSLPNVKVDPNLQINIQVHIDPNTPDEKIEVIFKNMRRYLLGKET